MVLIRHTMTMTMTTMRTLIIYCDLDYGDGDCGDEKKVMLMMVMMVMRTKRIVMIHYDTYP